MRKRCSSKRMSSAILAMEVGKLPVLRVAHVMDAKGRVSKGIPYSRRSRSATHVKVMGFLQ